MELIALPETLPPRELIPPSAYCKPASDNPTNFAYDFAWLLSYPRFNISWYALPPADIPISFAPTTVPTPGATIFNEADVSMDGNMFEVVVPISYTT